MTIKSDKNPDIENKQNEKIKKPEKKKKQAIAIRAEKVKIKYPNGIIQIHHKNYIIENPWPKLMQVAHLDSKNRIFAIIEK